MKEARVLESTETGRAEGLIKRITSAIAPIVKRAMALVIHTDEDLEVAGGFLKTIKGFQADVDTNLGPLVDATNKAHKAAVALKKRAEAPLIEAEVIIKPKIARYQREQEEERLRELNRKRWEAEEAARAQAEQERLERARKAAEAGEIERASRIVDEPVEIKPVHVPMSSVKPVAKVEGISVRRTYSAEVTDLKALVDAVARGEVSIMAVQANMVFLNRQATAFKDTEKLAYPGVKVVWKDGVAAGN